MRGSNRVATWRTLLAMSLTLLFLAENRCLAAQSGSGASVQKAASQKQRPSTRKVENLAGDLVDPFRGTEGKAVVFIVVRPDCPISNKFVPEMRRLAEEFGSKSATLQLVYADTDLSVEEIQKHMQEYDLLALPVLRDPEHELVRLCKARVTPEAAVFAPDGKLVYHGRIDDRYAAFGKARPSPTQRDLRKVLVSLAEGKTVIPFSTRAVGCAIDVSQ